jgi:hypothetical protein
VAVVDGRFLLVQRWLVNNSVRLVACVHLKFVTCPCTHGGSQVINKPQASQRRRKKSMR